MFQESVKPKLLKRKSVKQINSDPEYFQDEPGDKYEYLMDVAEDSTNIETLIFEDSNLVSSLILH